MDKKETLKLLHDCVLVYDKNLKDYDIAFVFENPKSPTIPQSINFIETTFYKHNFLHLTGIKYTPTDKNIKTKYDKAIDFYEKLQKQKLSSYSIKYSNPFTTGLKLNILNNLMYIDKAAKFLGNYNGAIHNNLYTEKVVGNVRYCMGFVKDSATKYYYVPNTTIKENIKNITTETYNIIAILKKPKSERFYANITYLKNDIDLNCLLRNNTLANRIDFEHIRFDNSDNIKNTDKVNRFRLELRETVRKFEEEMLGYSNIQADENETSIEPDIDDEYNDIDLDI